MAEDPGFADLLRRLRAGDEGAAVEFVARFGPEVRRLVRYRLVDARLRRHFDSEDVCQSVLGSFLVRAALGAFRVDTPDQLVRLLATMARNKLANQANRYHTESRDLSREVGEDVAGRQAADTAPDPGTQAELRDLLSEARRRLGPDERRILELLQQGGDWEAVAAELGGSPE